METKGWKKGPKSKIKHNPNLVAWDELVDLSQERGKYLAKQLPTILKKANFEIIPIVKDTETFARILHNNYLMRHGKDSDDKSLESDAALRPWMDLTDEFRLSNIHQAENIFRKLADNGWTVQRKKRGGVQHFSGKEISLMAEQEHIRWMKERLDQGWIYAPGPKNTTTRENPLLRNWDKLTPNEQHETREEVASWPELLKCAGLFLVRKEPANDSSGKSK
ncbi:MAG: RyR domain-containing protein [Candidatus Sumerlaeota bacterium]|nr:RyR domain-containing protein [Candidatus Sumerlaeota bacterium]